MTDTTIAIRPERIITWEQWQSGRAERRRLGNLVAPKNIRRKKSEGDEYLRETYGGERGPKFNKPFDPSADEV
jgi:hypothetical protein